MAQFEQNYLQFLRFCLDDGLPLPASVKDIDWVMLMDWAKKQAIAGVIFGGILRAGKTLNIPFKSLMEWTGYALQVEHQNKLLNKCCVEVVKEYQSAGFKCVILKGQGNALMYPNPLLRNCGDIDLLVTNKSRQEITRFVKGHQSLTGHHFHHIEYKEDGLPVEVHFYACTMNNPIYKRRLNKWLAARSNGVEKALPDEKGHIPVPTAEFNVVFLLAHMMHHFFDEGIGLRQFVDYYYLLKANKELEGVRGSYRSAQGVKGQYHETLSKLNLYKFAGAVMYVMREVFHLEEQYMIAPVDEWRGKTLLNEILKGGNFGRSSNLDQNSAARKYFQKTVRNMHFVWQYPAEALCEPFFRTWHFFWRMAHRS